MNLELTSISSTAALKKNNCRNVYHTLYHNGPSTKQELVRMLQLSLPTVSHLLQDLQNQGLIELSGHSDSTGGRRPVNIRIIPTARVAAGLEILKESIRLIVVDLYGNPVLDKTLALPFHNTNLYFDTLSDWVNSLIHRLPYPDEHVLGIGIALQGLVSPDGFTLSFHHLLESGITLAHFSDRLAWPCAILHDVELAAGAEIAAPDGRKDAFYLSLNRNMGSALISGGKILTGSQNFSSTIEHMTLIPGGKPCYCGKSGCVEAYCSASALEEDAGMKLPDFFAQVRLGKNRECQIWRHYLEHLALVVDNIRMIFRCDILIGGMLQPYITPEDLRQLISYVNEHTFYKEEDFCIHLSHFGERATAIGGGLFYIKPFLEHI